MCILAGYTHSRTSSIMKCDAYAQPDNGIKSKGPETQWGHQEYASKTSVSFMLIFCAHQAEAEFINFPQEQGKQNNSESKEQSPQSK